MPVTRSYSSVGYALELDSKISGFLNGFEGGDATGDVVIEAPGPDRIIHKHLAGVKYEDIALSFGADMSDSVYDWIAATLGGTDLPKDGAVITADMNCPAGSSRMEFLGALIREITFPALDAGSTSAALIEIKFAPESTRSSQANAQTPTNVRSFKRWLPRNFRLQIDGLDCSKVSAIDALTISRPLVSNAAGETRNYRMNPGPLSTPNLAFTIAESGADLLIAWHEDFVINGNHGAGSDKNGTLQFLSPNLQVAFFTLTLRSLGIFKLAPEKVDANAEAARRLRAEMYCEEIGFQYMSAASAGALYGGADTKSGTSTDSSIAATQRGPKPPLRGGYVQGLATVAGSQSAIPRQTQPPWSGPVTNALNPGRPLKFRT